MGWNVKAFFFMGNICMPEFSPSDLQKQFFKLNLEFRIMLVVRCLGFFSLWG